MGRTGGRLTLEVAPGAGMRAGDSHARGKAGGKGSPDEDRDVQHRRHELRGGGCAGTIRTLVERQAGVQMATVSFDEGRARILYAQRRAMTYKGEVCGRLG